jgi:hypothetical protein
MKVMTKTIRGMVLTATLTLAIAGCEKQRDIALSPEMQTESSNESLVPEPLTCTAAIPDSLQPPAGNSFLVKTYATGVQIYQVQRNPANPTQCIWVNIAPRADLFATPTFSNHVGHHYAGPNWEFTKGPNKNERVKAAKVTGTVMDPTAVPWLLLKAVESQSSPGNRVSYIQRVCTTGGLAPNTPVGEESLGIVEEVPYTATYIFYTK